MCQGIAAELEGIDLGDKRLNKRSKRILVDLAVNPEASINASCGGWADTHAAYRFFDNDSVCHDEILLPHTRATIGRAREYPVVLSVQDTTELDYSDHPPSDARCLNVAERKGLYAHTHLAITPDKLILGVLGIEYFDREPDTLGQSDQRSTLPIEEKESMRWLNGYRLACRMATELPDTQVVSVADREGDIYDILVEAQGQPHPRADFIIRSRVDRCTRERDEEAGEAAYRKVRAEVEAAPLLTTRAIDLPRTPKRAARTARLEIRALRVELKPPHARSHLPSVTLNVVLAQEVGGPGDGTDVCWLLLSSLPISTIEEVLKVVDYYVARWGAEIYFRTWKTGCKVEEIQLEKVARLKRCLALYAIIAWRVLYLTYLNRTVPEVPCTVVFSEEEWQALWAVVNKSRRPGEPPSLAEVMRLVVQLGGYNNRPGEPPPGPQPVWIGLRRLADFVLAWHAFSQFR
jgi:hypothetical protein